MWNVVLVFMRSGRRGTVARNLTWDQAAEYVRDDEMHSQTATSATARKRTQLRGEWFTGMVPVSYKDWLNGK